VAGLGVPVVLATFAVLSLWFVGRDLDRPWIKSRVQAFTREQFGLGIDYEGVELSPSEGLRARSLRLLTPVSLVPRISFASQTWSCERRSGASRSASARWAACAWAVSTSRWCATRVAARR
jgi:hypothetical protein